MKNQLTQEQVDKMNQELGLIKAQELLKEHLTDRGLNQYGRPGGGRL